MATVRVLKQSFAGGEITPELYGRIELPKYQSGVASCKNFIVLPHGPVANRPGFEFVNQAKDSSKKVRLIPFSYSTTQTYALEFGHNYIRIHTGGGTLLETGVNITAATNANPCVITSNSHGFSNGDWVYISSVAGMTQLNGRYYKVANVATNTFELQDVNGTNINSTAFGTWTSGGTAARVYTITSTYTESEIFDIHFVQSADVLTLVHPSHPPRELKRLSATSWSLSSITFGPTVSAPTGGSATATSGSGTKVYIYGITSITADGRDESTALTDIGSALTVTAITKANPGVLTTGTHNLSVGDIVYVSGIGGMVEIANDYYVVNTVPSSTTFSLKDSNGTVVNTTSYTTFTSGGTVQKKIGITNDLTTTGNKNTIRWTAASGASRYNVYRVENGLYGYIGQTSTVSFVDDNYNPDTLVTPPETKNPFNATDKYPSAVTYYEQRRVFGGTNTNPQTFWMTRSATETNFNFSIPTQDSDGIEATVASRDVQRIRHFVPLSDLLFLTPSGEWRIGSGNDAALTPTTLQVKPQSYVGSSNVQPVVTGNSVLYVQDRGAHLREMAYEWQSSAYKSNDASIMAPHLFDSYSIIELAYARAPYQILWAIRSDGALLGMTYVPEHQVLSWHQHDTTGGTFESVCSVAEGQEDAVYVVVKRTVNGNTVRYIERLHSRLFADKQSAFFVDSGLTYSGASTSTITGLWHLEGKTVSVMADGAVHPQCTVASGSITLNAAATKVHVGLPITASIKTLPLAVNGAPDAAQGHVKNVNKVWLKVNNSSGIWVGPDATHLVEYKQRTTESYGSSPDLISSEIEIVLSPVWGRLGQIYVEQTDPLPLTLVSMVAEVSIGG